MLILLLVLILIRILTLLVITRSDHNGLSNDDTDKRPTLGQFVLESRVRVWSLYHTVPYSTIPYHTMPCHTILYYTILYYTILYYTILIGRRRCKVGKAGARVRKGLSRLPSPRLQACFISTGMLIVRRASAWTKKKVTLSSRRPPLFIASW